MTKKFQILLIIVLFGFSSIFHIISIENEPDNFNKVEISIKTSASSWEVDDQGNASYIVDGDTFDVDDVGRIRLADINASEMGEPGYQEAKNYLNSSIYNVTVFLDIDDVHRTDSYGRIVAVTYKRHNSTHYLNVNKDLLEKGHAVVSNYDNEFNPSEWTLYVTSPRVQTSYTLADDNDDKEDSEDKNYDLILFIGVIVAVSVIAVIIVIVLFILYNEGYLYKSKKSKDTPETKSHKVYTPYKNSNQKEIRGIIIGESEKSLFLNFGGDKNYWIPKSTIHSKFTNQQNQPQNFIIDAWILNKNNVETGSLKHNEIAKNYEKKVSSPEINNEINGKKGNELRGSIVNETERALCIKFENGQEEWIPKSTIYSKFNPEDRQIQDFNIEEWMLKKKKLI